MGAVPPQAVDLIKNEPHLINSIVLILALALTSVACSSDPAGSSSTSSATSGDASSDSSDGSDGSTGTGIDAPFTLTSPTFTEGGDLPAANTCDGIGHSPAQAWSGVPAGTAELALLMTTIANDGLQWNWVLFGIPKDVTSLDVGATDVGTFGLTSDGPNLAYAAPCSQGPGAKAYTFTIYALSARPTVPSDPKQVTGGVLTSAMESLILGTSAIHVTYTRP